MRLSSSADIIENICMYTHTHMYLREKSDFDEKIIVKRTKFKPRKKNLKKFSILIFVSRLKCIFLLTQLCAKTNKDENTSVTSRKRLEKKRA